MEYKEVIEKLNKLGVDIGYLSKNLKENLMKYINDINSKKDIDDIDFKSEIENYITNFEDKFNPFVTSIMFNLSDDTIKNIITTSRLKLSNNLYNDVGNTKKIIAQHLKDKSTAKELSLALYDGYKSGIKELDIKDDKKLPKYLIDASKKLFDNGVLVESAKISNLLKNEVAKIKTTNLRIAYLKVLESKTKEELEKNLKVAVEEKSRYYADRIAQTETMRSYDLATTKENYLSGVKYEQWHVNRGRSRKADICDFHDKKIYKVGEAPCNLHPFCKCRKTPYYGKENIYNSKNEREEFKSFNKDMQIAIAGSEAKRIEYLNNNDLSLYDLYNRRRENEYKIKPTFEILRELGEI